jgi:NADPH2 dehydrogenase
MQLWALGRAGTQRVLSKEPGGPFRVVSSSTIGLTPGGPTRGTDKPHELSEDEIQQYVQWYAQAARNFVEGAGGDGVESECLTGRRSLSSTGGRLMSLSFSGSLHSPWSEWSKP